MNKKYSIEYDPNKTQELKKYKDPIQSRKIILQYLNDIVLPVTFEKICCDFNLNNKEKIMSLTYRLKAMIKDKEIKKNKDFYTLYKKNYMNILGEIYIDNNQNVCIKNNKLKYKIVIQDNQKTIVFPKDQVQVKILGINTHNIIESELNKIIKRNTHEIIGYYFKKLDNHYIKPLNKSIRCHISLLDDNINELTIKNNDLVKIKIIMQPNIHNVAIGTYIKHINNNSNIYDKINIVLEQNNLYSKSHLLMQKEIDNLKSNDHIPNINNRIDLRFLPFITIDDDDAKDFDDAIYVNKKNNIWTLYVAIADVTHYVSNNSIIDQEAKKQSTSIYFPGKVVHMLPEILSNNICSLIPNKDRLAIILEIQINNLGNIQKYKFYEGVINSKARLTYNEVNNYLINNNDKLSNKISHEVKNNIDECSQLFEILKKQKIKRGAIIFNNNETKIVLDKNNNIINIIPIIRNKAHYIIEEFMLLANLISSQFLKKNNITFPYRVHDIPSQDKIEKLKIYLHNFNIKLNKNIQSLDINKILTNIKNQEIYDKIQSFILKSMNKAIYTIHNIGHFSLSYPSYTHFTSPIRRYIDIIIHRKIKQIIHNTVHIKDNTDDTNNIKLQEICEHASIQERNADKATREIEDWLKCEFLINKINQTFVSKINHITSFGMFVEICNFNIEGLITLKSLKDDFYIFQENLHQIYGKRNKKIYSIGQKINVKIKNINLTNNSIDLILIK